MDSIRHWLIQTSSVKWLEKFHHVLLTTPSLEHQNAHINIHTFPRHPPPHNLNNPSAFPHAHPSISSLVNTPLLATSSTNSHPSLIPLNG
jgi:hypothetical protein